MTLSQRLALGSLVLAVGLGGAHLVLSRAQPVVQRLHGSLAPLRPLGAAEVVGRVDPARLGKGQIVGVAYNGSDVFLLQQQGWLSVGPTGVHGPFGAEERDGEGRIISGADIAVRDSVVYVLDRVTKSVLTFTTTGQWRSKLSLSATASLFGLSPEHITVAREGQLTVSGFRGLGSGEAGRVLLRDNARGTFDTLATIPAALFDIVLPVSVRSGNVLALESSSYGFTELDSSGGVVRRFERREPPRVPLSDSLRRSLVRLAVQASAPGGPRRAIPKYLPAAFAAIERPGGSFVVAIMTAIDSVLLEELDADGKPLWTLTPEALPLPIGLTPHGVITLREEVNATIVERRHWVN